MVTPTGPAASPTAAPAPAAAAAGAWAAVGMGRPAGDDAGDQRAGRVAAALGSHPRVTTGGKVHAMKNPDCRDGKHASCAGDGWDEQTDQPAPCACTCHGDPLLDACSGGETCFATYHRHGCYADASGGCDRPEEHTIAADTPRQRLIGDN